MTLPVSISGIDTGLACVGPFQSSAGNYYFFGKDASTGTTLQCYKATDPTDAWASIATKTGYSTAIKGIYGRQVSDTIHLCISDGTDSSKNVKYLTFNMAADAFDIAETIASGLDGRDNSGTANYQDSLAIRATGEVVVCLSASEIVSGNRRGRVYYSRRTGTNTWTALTALWATTGGDFGTFGNNECVIGAADRIHFFYGGVGSGLKTHQSLDNGNSLVGTGSTDFGKYTHAISFAYGSVTRLVLACVQDTPTDSTAYFKYTNSSATSIFYTGNHGEGNWSYTGSTAVSRLSVDLDAPGGAVVYGYFRQADDGGKIYYASSSNGGVAWTAGALLDEVSTVEDDISVSLNAPIINVAGSVAIPYIVKDSGNNKYNQHGVRSQIRFKLEAATASAAAAVAEQTVLRTLGSTSATANKASPIPQGVDKNIDLIGVQARININFAGYSIAGVTTGAAGSITRLGPGGYPIAAIPTAAAGAETLVSLSDTASSGATGDFAGYTLAGTLSAATATAAAALPVWRNQTFLLGSAAAPLSGDLSHRQELPFDPAPITASAGDLAPELSFGLSDISSLAAWGNVGISISKTVALEATLTAAFANEMLPFIGRFVALDSIYSSALAADAFASISVIAEAISSNAVAGIPQFEGDEVFSLEAAAASGIVGELTCAIIIPSAVVICAMNAAMSANSLAGQMIPNDLAGSINIGSLVAAMATGAIETEMSTGSMQASIRCH